MCLKVIELLLKIKWNYLTFMNLARESNPRSPLKYLTENCLQVLKHELGELLQMHLGLGQSSLNDSNLSNFLILERSSITQFSGGKWLLSHSLLGVTLTLIGQVTFAHIF